MPEFRQDDTPQDRTQASQRRNTGRGLTVFMSIIAAGIVALFFGYANDVDQRSRSIKNCDLIQKDRRDFAARLAQSSDQVLGNPDKKVKPFDFKHTAFAKFKPLIVAQAKQDRAQSVAIYKRIEHCEKVFPKPSLIP